VKCAPYLNPEMSMEMGGSAHFEKERGYATTMVLGGDRFHLRIAERFLTAPLSRQDAVVRHEIGHIIDFSVPGWWLEQSIPALPTTPERRADRIAAWIWGAVIGYDTEDVQTLFGGVAPRPEHLGL
jgi:hypothetical protein